jgi:hypothetical protein
MDWFDSTLFADKNDVKKWAARTILGDQNHAAIVWAALTGSRACAWWEGDAPRIVECRFDLCVIDAAVLGDVGCKVELEKDEPGDFGLGFSGHFAFFFAGWSYEQILTVLNCIKRWSCFARGW